ncbi:MAG: thioredoxin domain-containing protein [Bacteroidetes bacterium]|nr:thioredoxin domain-containing protein [Bacteroidota bacterium]
MQTTKKSNSLINEKSPYLLQHAYNPVNWHPWNEKTFALARDQDKPVFLSVGYSTCYWCHVMEREVFENEQIAGLMNEYFINIKVDREERPDVDRVYMTALQAMTGSGGWPMSMFLTPELKPFYGATYIPPKAKYGRAGFEDVITQINDAWKNRREEVISSGDKIVSKLQQLIDSRLGGNGHRKLTHDELDNAFKSIVNIYDDEEGGFGKGNKFPRPVVYNFLLDYYYHKKEFKALDIVTYTLKKMYEGGMYDHLEGGFHRYSVDHFWRVPHFEKMLYDQAQLISTYIDTYLVTKNKFFLFVAEDTAEYVMNNLSDKNGGFYSAEDAESAPDKNSPDVKEEGAFYLWEKNEIEKILGKDNAEIFNFYFGILSNGNTVNDPHEVFGNKNVLYIANDIYETAKQFERMPEDIAVIIDECRTKLLKVRSERPRPHLDDKILTSWNGLTVSAFAKLYRVTGEEKYLSKSVNAAEFIIDKLYDTKDKVLLHRFRDGESRFSGTLEDYSFFIAALTDLYETVYEIKYLELALELNEILLDKFYDNDSAGFFDVMKSDKDILLKTRDTYDGAEPAGNSIQIMNLLKLGFMTDNKDLIDKAEKSLNLFQDDLKRLPFSSPQMLCALSFYLNSPKEIILNGKSDSSEFKELSGILNNNFIPNSVRVHAGKKMSEISPFIGKITGEDSKTEVFLCENYKCELPVSDPEALNEMLNKK